MKGRPASAENARVLLLELLDLVRAEVERILREEYDDAPGPGASSIVIDRSTGPVFVQQGPNPQAGDQAATTMRARLSQQIAPIAETRPDLARVLEDLGGALASSAAKALPAPARTKAFELLGALTSEAQQPKPSRTILESLGESFNKLVLVGKVEPLVKLAERLEPLIRKLWD